jgi:hypothetical protein
MNLAAHRKAKPTSKTRRESVDGLISGTNKAEGMILKYSTERLYLIFVVICWR